MPPFWKKRPAVSTPPARHIHARSTPDGISELSLALSASRHETHDTWARHDEQGDAIVQLLAQQAALEASKRELDTRLVQTIAVLHQREAEISDLKAQAGGQNVVTRQENEVEGLEDWAARSPREMEAYWLGREAERRHGGADAAAGHELALEAVRQAGRARAEEAAAELELNQQALAELRGRYAAEKAEAERLAEAEVEEVLRACGVEMDGLREEHARLDQLHDEDLRLNQAALAELRAGYREEKEEAARMAASALDKLNESHVVEMQEHTRRLESAQSDWDRAAQALEEAKRSQARETETALEDLRRSHAAEMECLTRSKETEQQHATQAAEAALEDLRRRHATETATLRANTAQLAQQRVAQETETALQELRTSHAAEIETLRAYHGRYKEAERQRAAVRLAAGKGEHTRAAEALQATCDESRVALTTAQALSRDVAEERDRLQARVKSFRRQLGESKQESAVLRARVVELEAQEGRGEAGPAKAEVEMWRERYAFVKERYLELTVLEPGSSRRK